MRTFVGIGSGTLVSSSFALEHADRGFSVMVPNLGAPSAVYVQFAQSSGGTFHDLARPDGSGAPFAVHSGSGVGVGFVAQPPTPWGRLRLSTPASEPTSAAILLWVR